MGFHDLVPKREQIRRILPNFGTPNVFHPKARTLAGLVFSPLGTDLALYSREESSMNNKKVLILALIVVALVGFFMMVDKKSDDAIAAEQQPAVTETVAQTAPEVTQPAATETAPAAEPVKEEAPAQPSLGASSSGLGR